MQRQEHSFDGPGSSGGGGGGTSTPPPQRTGAAAVGGTAAAPGATPSSETDATESHFPSPARPTFGPPPSAAREGNSATDGHAAAATGVAAGSTHAVNTAYSRRLVVGGDRALVVHFTHNPNQNLAPAEQLLGQARVAIPAICNYLYFRAGKLAVVYFGKTRNAAGRKVGVVGGDDMKQRLLRYLTVEIWPPLRTDVPDDSGEHAGADKDTGAMGQPESSQAAAAPPSTPAPEAAAAASNAQDVPSSHAQTLDTEAIREAAAAGHVEDDPSSPAGPLSSGHLGRDFATETQKTAATAASRADRQRQRQRAGDNDDDNDEDRAGVQRSESQTATTECGGGVGNGSTSKLVGGGVIPGATSTLVKRLVLPMPYGEGGRGMQVLVYLKPGGGTTKYLKLVLANIERLHFDVVDTREEKHRWENRKLHIRMLDSLETQKAIFSYSEYESALREACQFSVDHRDDEAEAIIAECEEATLNGPTGAASPSVTEDLMIGRGGESPGMGPAASPNVVDPSSFAVSTSPLHAAATGDSLTQRLRHLVGPATTPLLYALSATSTSSRPVSPSQKSAAAAQLPAGATFSLGMSAHEAAAAGLQYPPPPQQQQQQQQQQQHGTIPASPATTTASASTAVPIEPGRVHCVVTRDHYYAFYQPMHLPESATLDYKSYFFNTAKEIQDRAVKFMCGFLNAYGHGKLVVGVHEIRGVADLARAERERTPSNSSMPRDGRAVMMQREAEQALSSAKEGGDSPTSSSQRPTPDQLVVGASLSAEEIFTLVNDLTVQLMQCVPPIPPEIVHINLVPVRLPAVPATNAQKENNGGASPSNPTATTSGGMTEADRLMSLPTPPRRDRDEDGMTPRTKQPSLPGESPTARAAATAAAASAAPPGTQLSEQGLFPDLGGGDGDPSSGLPNPGPAAAAGGSPAPKQKRQRVLVLYEPPSANWWHTFQQKANYAVRVLAKHGFSLVPIDLPMPRLQPPLEEDVPPRQQVEAPPPLARHSRGSLLDVSALQNGDDDFENDGDEDGGAASSAAARRRRRGGDDDDTYTSIPTTTVSTKEPNTVTPLLAAAAVASAATSAGSGPLHGVVHPIPHDWFAQCYAIVPFAPNAAAQAAIFAQLETPSPGGKATPGPEKRPDDSASSAASKTGLGGGEYGSSDVVEVIDSSGVWSPYDENNSRIVSEAKAKGDATVQIRVSKRVYSIDLNKMIQTNVKTRTNRQIRIRHFGGVQTASDDGTTLADHELAVMRGLSMQKTQRQCIVWANGADLPELFIIDVSVDLRRLPDDHPLRRYKGKFFNGWPSIPVWDPLSHCVRRAPRNYNLVLQRRHSLAHLLRGTAATEWFQVPELCALISGFVPRGDQRDVRLVNRLLAEAVEVNWGRDVVRSMCDDTAALMRDAVVPVPFDAMRTAQAALRREYGHPEHGGGAHGAAMMANLYVSRRIAQQQEQALYGPTHRSGGAKAAAFVDGVFGHAGGRKAMRRARRHMLGRPHAGPAVLPLMLCWAYEMIGALPAPYPHVPMPLQLQHVRVAPHLVTLFMMPAAGHAHWSLIPSLVLDLNDGYIKFFYTPPQPQPQAAQAAMTTTATGLPPLQPHMIMSRSNSHGGGGGAEGGLLHQQPTPQTNGTLQSSSTGGGSGNSADDQHGYYQQYQTRPPWYGPGLHSTEQLLGSLRNVAGAVCDAHTSYQDHLAALAWVEQEMWMARQKSDSNSSTHSAAGGGGAATDPHQHLHAGGGRHMQRPPPLPPNFKTYQSGGGGGRGRARSSMLSDVLPIRLMFVDPTVAFNRQPWRLHTLLVWLQLVAKDPCIRHHGAPASGSTVVFLCSVHEVCSHHLQTPVAQSAGGSGGMSSQTGSYSFTASPQPVGGVAAGFSGLFPSGGGHTAGAASNGGEVGLLHDGRGTTGDSTPAPIGSPTHAAPPPCPSAPATPVATRRGAGAGLQQQQHCDPESNTAAAAGDDPDRSTAPPMSGAHGRRRPPEFPSAPGFALQLGSAGNSPAAGASHQQQQQAAHRRLGGGMGPRANSTATPGTAYFGLSNFDCPLHRAEAEWAMW